MKSIPPTAPWALAALLAVALGGCAAAPQHSADHAHASAGTMDMRTMCDRHKGMMSGKPAAAQEAMMQEHMKSMPPEMRQRMQAMHEQCK